MSFGTQEKAPWHLWAVGLIGLLWNVGGAYDYIQTKLVNRDYLSMMEDSMGVPVDTVIAYFEGFPLWANIAWGLGVWSSVVGSLLLLFRSRFAPTAFLLSLIGFLGGMLYQFMNPLSGATSTSTMYIMTGVIFVLIVVQLVYAQKMKAAGLLR